MSLGKGRAKLGPSVFTSISPFKKVGIEFYPLHSVLSHIQCVGTRLQSAEVPYNLQKPEGRRCSARHQG